MKDYPPTREGATYRYPKSHPRELLEGEIGSLNLFIDSLVHAIKNVRDTFRDLDHTLFVTDDDEIRQRELSSYEKAALRNLYAAMNEPADKAEKP